MTSDEMMSEFRKGGDGGGFGMGGLFEMKLKWSGSKLAFVGILAVADMFWKWDANRRAWSEGWDAVVPFGEMMGGRAWVELEVDLERRWRSFQSFFGGVSDVMVEQVDSQAAVLERLMARLREQDVSLRVWMRGMRMVGEEVSFLLGEELSVQRFCWTGRKHSQGTSCSGEDRVVWR